MSQFGKSTSISSSAGPVDTAGNGIILGMAATIFFFVVVIFFAILYLYAKHIWANRRSSLIFASYNPLSFPRCGLSSEFLEGLPITVFQSAVDPEEELECAVCLSKLRDGEQVRMLPKCNHGFHLECIDEWFQSQSTCPLCRSLVQINPAPDSNAEEVPAPETFQRDGSSSTESPTAVLPANILAAAEANLNMTSSSVKQDGRLVIEIPRLAMEGFSLPSTSAAISERMKTPISARRRLLTRQLSQEKRTVGSSAASTGGSEDIEQGLRGAAGESWRRIVPRIPRNS